MSDPSRWNEEGADDFERSLLGSAKSDRMSDASRERIAAALGAATVLGTTEATASTSTSASTATSGFFGAVKLVLIGSLVAIGAAGFVYATKSGPEQRVAPNAPPSASVAAVMAEAAGRDEPTSPSAVAVEPTVRIEDLPAAAAVPSKPATARSAPAVATESVPSGRIGARSSLAAEATLLDGARGLLRSGDLAAASERLDAYEREFAAGALEYEAAVMRVDLLVARGDRVEAKAQARKLLEANPHGPYATRLRALVDGAP